MRGVSRTSSTNTVPNRFGFRTARIDEQGAGLRLSVRRYWKRTLTGTWRIFRCRRSVATSGTDSCFREYWSCRPVVAPDRARYNFLATPHGRPSYKTRAKRCVTPGLFTATIAKGLARGGSRTLSRRACRRDPNPPLENVALPRPHIPLYPTSHPCRHLLW